MSAEGTPVVSAGLLDGIAAASACRQSRAQASPAGHRRRRRAALVAAAIATPGFLTATSLFSLLTTMSFIGCVAVGMTFITLSGNVMSFCLGATAVGDDHRVHAQPAGRPRRRAAVAFLFSAALTGVQGWIVGYFRANPIIVSMAVLALIYGFVTL